MGNTTSLYIRLDKPFYLCGEEVRGAVGLDLKEHIATTGIQLEIIGSEWTSWDETTTTSADATSNSTVSRGGRKRFFSTVIPLGPSGELNPGQYQFQFSFTLPSHLPGSFRSHFSASAHLKYVLLARIGKSGMFVRDVKTEIELWLRPRSPPGLPPPQSAPPPPPLSETSTVHTCCCFSQGTVTLTAQIDKNQVQPGGILNLTLDISNTSSIAFKIVRVSLREYMCLREFSGGYNGHNCSQCRMKMDIPGAHIPAQSQGVSYRNVFCTVPLDINCWVESHLISCWHGVEVRLKSSSSFSSDVSVHIPLIIAGEETAPPAHMVAPPEWNPTKTYEEVQLGTLAVPKDLLPPDNNYGTQKHRYM